MQSEYLTSHQIRVESGSDDPDNVGHLGHFFDGSSRSHPQTKLSGCDPDFLVRTLGVCLNMAASVKQMNLGSTGRRFWHEDIRQLC